MAKHTDRPDVNEMFLKMGEKLGWFKDKSNERGKVPPLLSSSTKQKTTKSAQVDSNEERCNMDTDDGSTRKLKLKKKKNITGKQKQQDDKEHEVPIRQTAQTNLARTFNFQSVLSSDSDSSFSNEPDYPKKGGKSKAVLQLCSDSDDEQVSTKGMRTNSFTRVSESFLDLKVQSEKHHLTGDKVLKAAPMNCLDTDYDDTIINGRVSLSSCTLDLENLGEPLVESTRIHRRSSVSYKHILDVIDCSSEDENDGSIDAGRMKCIKKKKEILVDELLDTEASVCNETNYITAIETVEETLNSPSNVVREPKGMGNDVTNQIEIIKPLDIDYEEVIHKRSQYEMQINSVDRKSSDSSESIEEIEVIDTGTQTENVETVEGCTLVNKIDKTESTRKVHKIYTENTVSDDMDKLKLRNEYRDKVNLYEEETVEDNQVVVEIDDSEDGGSTDKYLIENEEADKHGISDQSRDDIDDLSERVDDIVEKLVSTTIETCDTRNLSTDTIALEGNTVFNNRTDSNEGNSAYYQETKVVDEATDSHEKVDIYEGETIEGDDLDKDDVNKDTCGRNHHTDDQVEGNSIDSEESIIEVKDVETQTDDGPFSTDSVENTDDTSIVSEECDVKENNNAGSFEELEGDDSSEEIQEIEKSATSVDQESYVENNNSLSTTHENGEENREVSFTNNDIDDEKSSTCSKDPERTEDVTDESDTSESVNEEDTSDLDSSSSGGIGTSFAKVAKSTRVTRQTKKQLNTEQKPEQSWRSSRRFSSESSGDDDLEAFFQKLKKKPEQKKSDSSSPVSLKDFIVEDDDMTSESDDSAFYLRETQQLENRQDRPGGAEVEEEEEDDDDDDSDVFSSKVYPESVTKHKKKLAKGKLQRNISWTFSSDSDSDTAAKNSTTKSNNRNKSQTAAANKPNNQKTTSKDSVGKPLSTSENGVKKAHCKIQIDFSSDSEDELMNIEQTKTRKHDKPSLENEEDKGVCDVSASKKVVDNSGSYIDNVKSPSETEQPLFKTPNPLRKKNTSRGSNKENEFKTPTPVKKKPAATPNNVMYISLSDDDSESESSGFAVTPSPSLDDSLPTPDSSSPPGGKTCKTPKFFPKVQTPLLKRDKLLTETPVSGSGHYTYSFLKSLSVTVEDSRRHPEARKFVNKFKKTKEELSQHLLKLYNETVFQNKLPSNLPVIWNNRLLRTAGYCAYKKNAKDDRDRTTRIELSTKVCDTAERVRDTLIHELCHAAVWLLNGVNGGHGPYWKYWARQAIKVHPELPTIDRCHSYSISTKYTYRCKRCGYSIGRHSKSLDTTKKVCGYCHGEFELIQNSVPTTPKSAASSTSATPRSANKFALFVKDNYNSVKSKNKELKHGEVMKELSKLFAENKISST